MLRSPLCLHLPDPAFTSQVESHFGSALWHCIQSEVKAPKPHTPLPLASLTQVYMGGHPS